MSLVRPRSRLGANPEPEGVRFAVWAPNAVGVFVMGDFNNWSRFDTPMPPAEGGTWEVLVPGVRAGARYKYFLQSRYQAYQTERADPRARAAELRPKTASIVWDAGSYTWSDTTWMERRRTHKTLDSPLSIYEVHLGGWRRDVHDRNRWLTYREIAPRLAQYVLDVGFTHVELMPVMEHPFDGSWGYQTTGYFAPTSRYGSPDDFKFLIDTLHHNDIGVILDWVPGHFARDSFALGFFDGTHLYEHADRRRGQHAEWGTLIFNYARPEVTDFLIDSALHWLDEYHADGLRIDAVASMLYHDFGHQPGDWLPNERGGRENLEAVILLRRLNDEVARWYPDCITVAEESTEWPHVTGPTQSGGLGFTYKWNMGWMHDVLEYFETPTLYRKAAHHKLTFGMTYQYAEHFMLPFSHDEVVHLKKSMLAKMPGDDWQKFANLRLLAGFMMTYPGKKFLFMGAEIGQWSEFNEATELQWGVLGWTPHQKLHAWFKAIVCLYRTTPALFEREMYADGFEWVECNDVDTSVYGYLRFPATAEAPVLEVKPRTTEPQPPSAPTLAYLVIANFTPVPRLAYRVALPWNGWWDLVLSSDDEPFGGTGAALDAHVESDSTPHHARASSALFTIPPLGLLIYRGEGVRQRPAAPVDTAVEARPRSTEPGAELE